MRSGELEVKTAKTKIHDFSLKSKKQVSGPASFGLQSKGLNAMIHHFEADCLFFKR